MITGDSFLKSVAYFPVLIVVLPSSAFQLEPMPQILGSVLSQAASGAGFVIVSFAGAACSSASQWGMASVAAGWRWFCRM